MRTQTATVEIDLRYSSTQSEMFFPESFFPKYTIAPKGRRGGLTHGAANAFIEYGLSEDFWFLPKGMVYILWGDTVSGNVDRYFDRYFQPTLRKIDPSQWKWRTQERTLRIGRAVIDFRSADRPENWEGFGYHIIFLNEAGIILQDKYLFDNTVMPMLMDFPDSKLIAAGTPKGKRHKGETHKFFDLYQRAQHDPENYRVIRFTGRNNPFIDRKELENIAAALDESTRRQEIEGEFCDVSERKFLYAFTEDEHVIEVYEPNPHLPLLVSFDFNKDPMTAIVGQRVDQLNCTVFDEIEMQSGSTPEVCDKIREKYGNWMWNMDVTGDATGRNRSALVRGNLNHYRIIKEALELKDRNLLMPNQNPALRDSRILCNSVLQNANVRVTKNCTGLVNDLLSASVDADGELVKNAAYGLHLFDGFRYFIHALFPDFLTHPHRYK